MQTENNTDDKVRRSGQEEKQTRRREDRKEVKKVGSLTFYP